MTLVAFESVLIANRGEIAVRISRTARALGFRTVAVYSDADADGPHVRAANSAVHIGEARPSESYLAIPKLVRAALASGCGAVHPGYGFLAENAEFARACVAAGLVFIGPPGAAIEAMGNKAQAKALMHKAGVPCVPGYQGEDTSDDRMMAEATRIGFPVMIKATAGGGGRGMRKVASLQDFPDALRSAKSEALHAFASDEVILEKAIESPRHIEIQVFADLHGNVVHLGERDCSVQRRHQKVIEEAPSPAVGKALRERMGDVAVAAARAIGYVGAGTLEFLLDAEGNFYFMEMNTRLQVEHGVTEAITGIDLVAWQLLVAQGQPLPLSQEGVNARLEAGGHAIEVRLCAEDPRNGFLPQSGRVALWQAPQDVRVDHAIENAMEVSPFYDSMLAKVVSHGTDREEARRKLALALAQCVLLGIPTNRSFLSQCVAHPVFVAGHATTAFIDEHLPAQLRAREAVSDELRGVAAALLFKQRAAALARQGEDELQGWSSSSPLPWPLKFRLNGEEFSCKVIACGDRSEVLFPHRAAFSVRIGGLDDRQAVVRTGGALRRVALISDPLGCSFVFDGTEHRADNLMDVPGNARQSVSMGGRVSAPINGRVVALTVKQGDAVDRGQVLLVLEAMKMEHSIVAPCTGTVSGIFASIGDQVAPGRSLAEITALESALA